MVKHGKTLSEIVHRYNNDPRKKTFKPENYLEIPRLFGPDAAIDMNRLVCQHQQNVASAYMRRIRRDKIKQRDVYYDKLQNIPMKIRRVAVDPNYVDPYTSLKHRLPKLGQDNKIKKSLTPPYPHLGTSTYLPHNGLSPNLNVLFRMNPGYEGKLQPHTQIGTVNTAVPSPTTNLPKFTKKSSDDFPFTLSPRRAKVPKLKTDGLPKIKKRLAIETGNTNGGGGGVGHILDDDSLENTPRCPTNSPRNAFWNFNVPRELKNDEKKSHVSSIPRGKDALVAINSVQKYNKPLPMISAKA